MRYTLFNKRRRRHSRRPDRSARRRPACGWSSTPRAKRTISPISGGISAARSTWCRNRTARLLALQGPAAAEVLAASADMAFMSWRDAEICGLSVRVSRSGYTGEDGFELSVAAEDAEALAARLLAHDAVAWAGLGARDSLRLEAGLCLYGHDIDRDDDPDGGRSRLDRGEGAGGRSATFRARPASLTSRLPAAVSAFAPRAGSLRAPTRPCRTLRAPRSAGSPVAVSARRSTVRSRWPICRSRSPSPTHLLASTSAAGCGPAG